MLVFVSLVVGSSIAVGGNAVVEGRSPQNTGWMESCDKKVWEMQVLRCQGENSA